MNFLGLAAAALGIVTFALSFTKLRARTKTVRWAMFAFLSVLAVPALLFAAYYLRILPERTWFYELRSIPGSEFLSLFLGAAAGAAAALLPRPVLTLPLAACIVLSTGPYLKPLLGPIAEREFSDRWKEDACLQSTASTCGPASVCTILRRLGAHPSERGVTRAAFSYSGGTEAWYLARYIRRQGFGVRFDFRPAFEPAAGLPALVGVRLGSAGHFIAVLEVGDGQVTFADPLRGLERLPMARFMQRYAFTGFHMVISKAAQSP